MENGVNKTNVDDKEQFPALSAGTGAGVGVATKLNFKEMILKNSNITYSNNSSSGTVVAAAAAVSSPPPAPKVRTEYAQQPQKSLSSGNIFLGAFYRPKGDEYVYSDDDGDNGGGGGGGGGGDVISSILIDSCDRKYDNLYR
jgi:hypothetical protein